MAYSKSPQISTYQTKTVQLVNTLNNRNSSIDKDLDFLNCFFEVAQSKVTGDKTVQAIKRSGLQDFLSLASSNVRGMHYWEDVNKLLVATDNDVTIYNSNTGAVIATLSNIFGTTTGVVGFSEYLYDSNDVKIVITDGTTLGTVDTSNTWSASADPELPVPHIPQPLFLDGYLFIVKVGTADIYNSVLNDPLSYEGDYISCEMFPDTVTAIVKLNNYILAFGSASIEYFWNAANDTGSPLQRNDTPIKLIGYLGGLAQHGNKVFFVGNTANTTPEVYMIEDFKIKAISDESVRRYLESLSGTLETVAGTIVSCLGHDFYILNVGNLTYTLDLQSEIWTRWAFKQTDTFPCTQAVSIKTNTTYATLLFLTGETTLMKVSPIVYQDDGVNFTMRIVTDREMFDTYNQKFMYRLIVNADRPSTNSTVSLSWSDDDYQTFGTVRTLNLNQELPCLYRLGRFRRRAFKLEYTDNNPLRLQNMDVDINLGQA